MKVLQGFEVCMKRNYFKAQQDYLWIEMILRIEGVSVNSGFYQYSSCQCQK
jgi:hypothetical protein